MTTDTDGRLLITGAHLLHPEQGELTDTSWLEVAEGRITATGTGRAPSAPDGVRVIDAAGATVMPGLIDGHVHVLITSLDPAERASWTPGYATVRALKEAGRMLRRGFTTVRDVGGADHGMARALDEGLLPGPRLVFGGKALSQTGGHGDMRPLSDDSVRCCQHQPEFARIADGVDAVRSAARDEFRKGARHLKMLLSGGVASPHDEVSAVQYTDEEIRAAVVEADHHNRYVTVHAYHPRGVNRALRAGVRCVEHGNLLDDETIELLLANDAFLVPTLVTYEQLAEAGRRYGLGEASYRKIDDVREAGLGALEKAHRAGVNIVYGSDLLGPMHSHQLDEFTLRAQVQPAADLIRSATTTAARLLHGEGRIGTLAAGAHADLLVLDGNPLENISVLTKPQEHLRHVIKAGTPM
ncbi:amidohydrolase family protein [Streptomyces sp. AcE210]|uniref:metal-dependent hydrolase family protein n=1 Tax=Streptomyces sp. AcE210 TaxID=2292703 RepID=UPI000E3034DF|nr:amidohydrolase family protein [Streptomyces sp. AcE210]RFC77213.1 amidohydrolase family protein [Streptomyces sp. AcE210]